MIVDPFTSDVAARSLTAMLNEHPSSENAAFGRWIDLVYSDLRQIAIKQMSANFDQPLRSVTESPTAVASDAVLKLLKQRTEWRNRAHFFGIATLLIRYIVNDYKDKRIALKRGKGNRGGRVNLELVAKSGSAPDANTAVFEAIEALAEEYPREAEVVSLHVFANNPLPQVANMIGVSVPTVERDWRFAKAWIGRFLEPRRDNKHESRKAK